MDHFLLTDMSAITRDARRAFRVKLFKLEAMFAVVAERTLIAAQQQKIDEIFQLFTAATKLRG